jgi:hypothetical protein
MMIEWKLDGTESEHGWQLKPDWEGRLLAYLKSVSGAAKEAALAIKRVIFLPFTHLCHVVAVGIRPRFVLLNLIGDRDVISLPQEVEAVVAAEEERIILDRDDVMACLLSRDYKVIVEQACGVEIARFICGDGLTGDWMPSFTAEETEVWNIGHQVKLRFLEAEAAWDAGDHHKIDALFAEMPEEWQLNYGRNQGECHRIHLVKNAATYWDINEIRVELNWLEREGDRFTELDWFIYGEQMLIEREAEYAATLKEIQEFEAERTARKKLEEKVLGNKSKRSKLRAAGFGRSKIVPIHVYDENDI